MNENDDAVFMSADLQGRFQPDDPTPTVLPLQPMILTLVFRPDHIFVSSFSFARTHFVGDDRKTLMLELETVLERDQALSEYIFHSDIMLDDEVVPTMLVEMDYGAQNMLHMTKQFVLMHVGIEEQREHVGRTTLHFKLMQLRNVASYQHKETTT